MPFPSTYSSFNRPSATDRLNSPSHSDLHNTVSSAVGQIEQTIGLSTSSLLGTLFYDIRSSQSNGGGHVQSANKGGTGQTSYAKGDLLVGQSTSVLVKLAAAQDGYVLSYNSSTASGLEAVQRTTPKIYLSASVVHVSVQGEVSIFSTTIPGSTLGTNNAVRATVFVNNLQFANQASVVYVATYGNNIIGSVAACPTGNPPDSEGVITINLLANNSTNVQRATTTYQLAAEATDTAVPGPAHFFYSTRTSSVHSSANQTLGLTVRHQNGSSKYDGVVVEKIT